MEIGHYGGYLAADWIAARAESPGPELAIPKRSPARELDLA
jgi:hypothetical protein